MHISHTSIPQQSGACFIKLGQWVATRPDLFSDELIEHLSTLHSQAPTHTIEQTRRKLFIAAHSNFSFPKTMHRFLSLPLVLIRVLG